jgi:DNA-binding CsgD family transcriptional regulator
MKQPLYFTCKAVAPANSWTSVLEKISRPRASAGEHVFTFAPSGARWTSSSDVTPLFSHGVNGLTARNPGGARVAAKKQHGVADGNFTLEKTERESVSRRRPPLAHSALPTPRHGLEPAIAAVQALSLIGLPAAALSQSFGVLAANEGFCALSPDVVRVGRDRIHFVDSGADALIASVIAGAGGHGARSIPVPAAGDRPPLILRLVEVVGAAGDIFATTRSLLVATPVVPVEIPAGEVIQTLLALTPTEARIARAIASGWTVEQIATDSGVTPATVRVQLRSIFEKTGVSRQVQLVRLISGMSIVSEGASRV